MRAFLPLSVMLLACTTTVKGEGPGGSTSSSTSTSSGGSSSGFTSSSGTSGTSTSGGTTSGNTTSSSGSGGACGEPIDCNGIPYCACPGSTRDGIGNWACSGNRCVVDCSDPLCP